MSQCKGLLSVTDAQSYFLAPYSSRECVVPRNNRSKASFPKAHERLVFLDSILENNPGI